MVAESVQSTRLYSLRTVFWQRALLAVVCLVAGTGTALAYIGDSFISIPGTTGRWQGANYRNWIRVEASYWSFRPNRIGALSIDSSDRLFFSGPSGPRPGTASSLVIAMGKNNPDLAQLMDKCANKTPIPELTYVEASYRVRSVLETGPRPAGLPEYWEYRFKDVLISDCPVVADAGGQALVVSFKDIQWLNYDATGPEVIKVVLNPQDIPDIKPANASIKSKTKSFVITWIAPANLVSDDQCPVMNRGPTQDDYYTLMPKAEADKERAKRGEKGVSYGGLGSEPEMDNRGPHKLNAPKLPGIVRDPGFAEPKTPAAYGLNLDGDDGAGPPPRGTCKHKNYVSVDGHLKDVDNQVYTVMGCIAGYQGKNGYMNQTTNKHRNDGTVTTLIEISGIDNEKNDDSVEIAVIYSQDKLAKDVSGKHFIPDYTFVPADKPELAINNRRLHGRIVDGVIIADPVKKFVMNTGLGGPSTLANAQMRLEILPDGNLRGIMAGYVEWKILMDGSTNSYGEQFFGYQAPGLYHAFKRNADGLMDPVTGECNGISTAFEIDGIPAFITAAPPTAQRANATVQKVP